MTDDEPSPLDAVLAELEETVARRTAAGEYPPGLEEDLDRHFAAIVPNRAPAYDFSRLRELLRELEAVSVFDPRRIPTATRVPAGFLLHRAVAKIVRRQTQGALEQVQAHADRVRAVVAEILTALETPAAHDHVDLRRQLDNVFERLAAYERSPAPAIAGLASRIDALERAQGAPRAPGAESRQ